MPTQQDHIKIEEVDTDADTDWDDVSEIRGVLQRAGVDSSAKDAWEEYSSRIKKGQDRKRGSP